MDELILIQFKLIRAADIILMIGCIIFSRQVIILSVLKYL